jgi:two-component system CheB/CheR fusion protein
MAFSVTSQFELRKKTILRLIPFFVEVENSEIIEAVLDSVRPAADSKNIILEITRAAGPLAIVGDSGRIQQIFWNLLTNAIKFTPSGGRISVRITNRGSHARIQVIDNGEGIDAEFLPRVFERFRQADTGKGRSQKGLGLGLTVVRELVQAHGGTIFAESLGRGKGSTFTVMFPIPAIIPDCGYSSLMMKQMHGNSLG